MTALSDWLHALPPPHVQVLRDFRRLARAAYPDDPAFLATALDAGGLAELLTPAAQPLPAPTPSEAAAILSAMPRQFVLMVGH